MTNLLDFINRTRTFLLDADGGFITDEDISVWVNEAQDDIAARLELFHEEVTGTTTGNTLPLPPDVADPELLEILSFRLGVPQGTTHSLDVEFVNDEVWNSWHDDGANPGVWIARVFNATIELYPTPKTGTAYTLRYARIPTRLEDGNAVSELPSHLQRKAVMYAVSMGMFKAGDVKSGNNYFAIYEQGLPRVAAGREAFQPGPLTLTYEPNIFDRDPEARHV